MALWICFLFLLMLVIFYGFLIKKVTPISLFVFLAFFYAATPVVFSSIDNQLFNIVADRYALFNSVDLTFGITFAIALLSIPMMLDWFLIKKINTLSLCHAHPNFQKLTTMRLMLKIFAFLSFVLYCVGVIIYGVDHYLYGYSDADIGTNYDSKGGSIIAFADVIFFVSTGMLSRITRSRILLLIIAIYAFLHFLSGARLMTLIGLLMIVFVHNNFVINITKKTLVYIFSASILIILVGALRGGSLDISAGFMEFGFVGFGYYNIIAIRPILDMHFYDLIKDVIIFGLPAVYEKTEYISKTGIVLDLVSNVGDISPVGGYFFLTDLYLYLGLLTPLAVLIIFFTYAELIYFSYKITVSKFSLIYSFFVGLMCSFVLINLLRNGILPASSAAFKSFFITFVFLILFRAYKFRIEKRRSI
jgi:hypothetical protein